MASKYFDAEMWNLAKDLPCHAEFIRYTWWHNLAIEVTKKRQLPAHVLFYEDYSIQWNVTVQALLDFLELSPALGAEPPAFISGKHYEVFFEPRHFELAGRLVKLLASAESWILLRRYFNVSDIP